MARGLDLAKYKNKAQLRDRYAKQLERLQNEHVDTSCIEQAVDETIKNLSVDKTSSLVIYGEPQSGKTEMMICLTAKLLDEGNSVVVHLMNDSLDLLTQNLKRFKASGMAPAPKSSSELLQSSNTNKSQELVVLCKKNSWDLNKLIVRLVGKGKVVVIDDEADYATPNSKINQGKKTTINRLVGKLIGNDGCYVGVTATPARLDLNDTFRNDAAKWVNFPPHPKYTGQDAFFPLDKQISYRLTTLDEGGTAIEARDALVRFLVTVAYLNTNVNSKKELNYTMLVHTSGKRAGHELDRLTIEKSVQALIVREHEDFDVLVTQVYEMAKRLYPNADPNRLTDYVVNNASRATLIVLNSKRDRKVVGESAGEPSSPFTVIIGGNIVSRGVTFANLLSMFFTRNVRNKMQQDTYIQRARMFGTRGEYLQHFELTIPIQLFLDWHKCFVYHKLALATIQGKLGSPVWIEDRRISVAARPSINKATVRFNKNEMSFGIFQYASNLDALVKKDQTDTGTLAELQSIIGGEALPTFLIDYIRAELRNDAGSLAIHTASSIAGSKDADQAAISRVKGLIGKSQLEAKRFPDAVHHVKIFHNKEGKARLFYKFKGSLQFVENLKGKQ